MYTAVMIRTQIYIPEDDHKNLQVIAGQKNKAMAEIIRNYIQDGIKKERDSDNSGIKVLQALSKLGLTGGPKDLSKNIDHYLYGGPKKK